MKNPCKTGWQQKWLALDVTHPDLQTLADAAQRFAARWYRNNPAPSMLVIYGESGSGKTHVARAVHRFSEQARFKALEDGHWDKRGRVPSVLFLNWADTTDGFKERHYAVVDEALDADLLFLDDIGAEYDPSRNAANQLCRILNHREKRFTVVTTNVRPEAWPERFDIRISDRLFRNSIIIDLSRVPSYSLR